jgi:UDP-glucose 4-epimerase
MARYLITGVAGFVGSWLARELVGRGETVRGIDNLSSGSLAALAGIENAMEFLYADLRNPGALEVACKDVDFILHQAAIDSVQRSIDDPIGTSGVNLEGTLHLISAAQNAGVRRIVFASSAAVYGDQADCPIVETAATNPLSPYATQKLSCEQYLANAFEFSGIETVSLRYFNVFGPRTAAGAPPAGAIAQFAAKMFGTDQGGPILYGDGTQTRDFVYISDVVQANLLALRAPRETVAGKVFNVGSGRAHTIRLAFESVASMIGYTGEPRFAQARPGEPLRSLASLEAVHAALGFQPAVSFAEGLYKTVSWYRQQLSSRPAKPRLERRKAERKPLLARQAGASAAAKTERATRNVGRERQVDAQTFADAVRNGELELFYQPILDLRGSRIAGVEALLRWRCENRLLTPAHFIHLAEEKGLTPLIGAWVFGEACKQIIVFQRSLRTDLRLAVNISPLELEQSNLLRTIDGALSKSGVDYSCLDLEVTERTLVRDCSTTQQNLAQLRRRGVRIAVDDFGIGYSNMNYLYRFPIDCIKIDQSFVQHRGHARVLDGIVAFARALGVRTVAEGVETAGQLSYVTQAQCDEAQGFYIIRPIPAGNLVQAIRDFEAAHAPERTPTLRLPGAALAAIDASSAWEEPQ